MDGKKIPQVAIIDYEMGNLFSVKRALENAGLNYFVTSEASSILASDAAILPGVGAFGDAMKNLSKYDLIYPVRDYIASGRPFMGVCLGMQLLMDESEEFGAHKGIGIFDGSVVRLAPLENRSFKIPQVGWNSIYPPADREELWNDPSSPLKNIKNGEYMYFVHSFCCLLREADSVHSLTNYEGVQYCSSVLKKNVFACQFHPEKSAAMGLEIYSRWAEIIRNSGGIK